jgi:anti-sigma factor RsiW
MPILDLEDEDLIRIDKLADDGQRALALLDQLPAAQRDAVRARVLDDTDFRAWAAQMGCSEIVSSVRSSPLDPLPGDGGRQSSAAAAITNLRQREPPAPGLSGLLLSLCERATQQPRVRGRIGDFAAVVVIGFDPRSVLPPLWSAVGLFLE